jgi:hypothetical protein
MQHSHTRIHHDTSVVNRKYADLHCVQESLTGWTLAPADQIWSSSYSRGLPVLLLWVAWTWVLKAVPAHRFGKLSESHYNMWGRRTKKWWRFRSQFAADQGFEWPLPPLSFDMICYRYFNDVYRKKDALVVFFMWIWSHIFEYIWYVFNVKLNMRFQYEYIFIIMYSYDPLFLDMCSHFPLKFVGLPNHRQPPPSTMTRRRQMGPPTTRPAWSAPANRVARVPWWFQQDNWWESRALTCFSHGLAMKNGWFYNDFMISWDFIKIDGTWMNMMVLPWTIRNTTGGIHRS